MTRRRTALAGLVLCLLATGLAQGVSAQPGPAARPSAAGVCAGQEPGTTDLQGLVGSAQPVVLVHGWTGRPMQATRKELERLPSRDRRQYLLFDYSRFNTVWPSEPDISRRLASYIVCVSETHRSRGGNGRVHLVAHSMGGTAIRFALDPRFGGVADLASRVGGVITIDTPHTGSMWGDTFAAQMLSNAAELEGGRLPEALRLVLPAPHARAWKCLAGGPTATYAGCARPPAMPASVPLRQLVGEVSVRRTLFGHEAYTMNFGGDVIVPSTSQWAGGPDFRTVPCTRTGLDLSAAGWLLLYQDSTALNIFSGDVEADLLSGLDALEPVVQGLMASGCSHMSMPTNAQALAIVDQTLDEHARDAGVTLRQLRAGPTPIPASCGHPATTIRNGTASFGPDGFNGFATLGLGPDAFTPPVLADLTGDGAREAIVVLTCSAGGVGWPDWLLVYGNGPELLGAISLADVPSTQTHASVTKIDVDGGDVHLRWSSYTGCCFNTRYLRGTVRRVGSEFRLTDVGLDPPQYVIGPGTFADVRVGETGPDLRDRGWAVPDETGICDKDWQLQAPDGIWADFALNGDPEDLDYVGIGFNAPQPTVEAVRTAEGIGVGSSVEDVWASYGQDVPLLTDIPVEGDPYDALVHLGDEGALLLAIESPFEDDDAATSDLSLWHVSAMFAVRGTSLADVVTVPGGC